jgi:hypothetical protein
MCTVPCIKGEREKTGEKDGDCLYHHKIVVVVCFVFVFLIREGMKKNKQRPGIVQFRWNCWRDHGSVKLALAHETSIQSSVSFIWRAFLF